jgi:hypothetical protein
MQELPFWFNENEYANFLAESSMLWEVNIPYQKQRFENRKKIMQFDRETAIRRGRLKSELIRDLYRAKAKGEKGISETFADKIDAINSKFMSMLLAEAESKKTLLKAEKQRIRPEVDPKDRDRDRKREDRRQKKQDGLSNIIIVKNNKLNKIEIITKEDFNREAHTLLKGKVKTLDKGNVSKRDLTYYSKLENFMNTKTSIRLLGGRVEKENQVKKDVGGSSKVKSSDKKTEDSEQQIQAPLKRVPKDGKEITDAASTYPDWDHTTNQFVFAVYGGLNSAFGKGVSKEYNQMVAMSQTLAPAMERFVKGIYEEFPMAASMTFKKPEPSIKTSKSWSSLGVKQSQPVATIIGTGGEAPLGVSIKVGEQLRPCNKGEAGLVFMSALNAIPPENIIKGFSLFFKDFIQELKTLFTASVIPAPIISQNQKEGAISLAKERAKAEQVETTKKTIINKVSNLIEQYLNEEKVLKTAFLFEALTGTQKFDGKTGSAQMMFTSRKDGSDVRAIPLTPEFCRALANSSETYISLKFASTPNSSQGFLQSIFGKITPLTEGAIDAIGDIERFKDNLSNPVALMQAFELQLTEASYSDPVVYSDYYAGNTERNNTVTFNPGSSSEEEVQIPVRTPYTTDGNEENFLEKGADDILNEYLLVNDYLVESIKTGKIDLLDAIIFLEEEFDLVEKRNYRKEYDNYHSKKKQRKNRSKRVMARRKMMKKGRVKKGDGKDVHHEDGNPQNNNDSNLKVLSKSKNRSMNEDHGAGFEGTPELVKKLLQNTPFSNFSYVGKKSKKYPEAKLPKKK